MYIYIYIYTHPFNGPLSRTTWAIYIAPKSKIESRAHYAPEPTWGICDKVTANVIQHDAI